MSYTQEQVENETGQNGSRDDSAPRCAFIDPASDLYLLRRSVLSPFLSKTNVRKFVHVIKDKTEQLMDRLSESKESGIVRYMNAVFAALSNDVITYYTCNMNHN
jgi:hypothetical protein